MIPMKFSLKIAFPSHTFSFIFFIIFVKTIFSFRQITNIDISQLVINQMISKNKEDRPDMHFVQMDACHMSFTKDKFSVVLDKGKKKETFEQLKIIICLG